MFRKGNIPYRVIPTPYNHSMTAVFFVTSNDVRRLL